jgi:transposase
LLARRILQLTQEIHDLVHHITTTITRHCPRLLTRRGVGPDNAAALLITAGDNPDRLHSEASFAALCGVNPLDASSGKTSRRRLM